MDEDRSLIERYLGGDEYAVEGLVMKYQRRLYALLYRMTGDVEESKDLTQRAFMQAFTGIRGFRYESSFRTWLYRIAVNACLTYLKDGRLSGRGLRDEEITEDIEGGGPGALPELLEKERKALIRESLTELPERQKTALVLRAYEGLSLKETAEAMTCTEGAVKAHYHNGVKRLREILGRKGCDVKA